MVPGFSCATCHTAPRWTVSQVDYTAPPSPEVGLGLGSERVIGAELRQTATQMPSGGGPAPGVLINVGTFTPDSPGGRVNEIRVNTADAGQAIAPHGANGFNVPSLLSISETAPYFYNGLATSLSEVLDGSHDNNGGTRHHFVVSATDRANLIAFLRSIDSKDVAPEVVADPLDQPVCPGATATFTASASGTPPPAIQWQQSTNGGSTFSDIIGATSSSLVFTVDATQNGNLYRAVFTNRLGTVTSRAAMLSVSLLVTSNPTSKTASAGATVSFTAAASGSPTPTVKWQSSSDGGATFSTINGANATTLTFMATPFDNGRLFRAVFTNACGSVNTSAATSTVRQFTDPTLLKGTTPIRAIHIQERRARVDEQRARFILPAFPWTDPTLTIVTTPVRAVHVTELREALRQAYVAANRTVPVYTDATVTGGVTTIKAVHIEQLRTAVVALE